MTEYYKGKLAAISEMTSFCENQLKFTLNRHTSGTNSPAQIHDGGRIKVLQKIIQKLNDKRSKIYKKHHELNG